MNRILVFVLLGLLCPACFEEWIFDDEGRDDFVGEVVPCGVDSGVDGALEVECRVLELVNQQRTKGGDCGGYGHFGASDPLVMNRALLNAARLHSQDMATRDYFDHESPGGPQGDNLEQRVENAGYLRWSALGENIAAGQATPDEVMMSWMDSADHCKNILDPIFEEIGIGYAEMNGNTFTHYWTQNFGTPR